MFCSDRQPRKQARFLKNNAAIGPGLNMISPPGECHHGRPAQAGMNFESVVFSRKRLVQNGQNCAITESSRSMRRAQPTCSWRAMSVNCFAQRPHNNASVLLTQHRRDHGLVHRPTAPAQNPAADHRIAIITDKAEQADAHISSMMMSLPGSNIST